MSNIQDRTNKTLDTLNQKLLSDISEIENITYTKAIRLLMNNANPDKVMHWVNNTITTFNSAPQPMSDKEAERREKRKELYHEKRRVFNLINNTLEQLLKDYGVYLIGLLDYKQVSSSEYNHMLAVINERNHHMKDVGDGGYNIFISREELDENFFTQYDAFVEALNDIPPRFLKHKNPLDNILTYSAKTFRERLWGV
jgi:hypothetical protein